jgi:hypothetical protein
MTEKLKSNIKNLGYSYLEVGPGILEVYNVLSDEDIQLAFKIIQSKTQSDWEEDYKNSQVELAYRKYGRKDLDNMISEGLVEYTTSWYDKAIKVSRTAFTKVNKKIIEIFSYDNTFYFGGIDTIQRQYEGEQLVEHVDNDADPDVAFAAIAYINDDYEKGELFFSNFGLEVRPKAGSLMIFPGGKEYSHGVRAPGIGPIRYVLPTFIRNYSPSIP